MVQAFALRRFQDGRRQQSDGDGHVSNAVSFRQVAARRDSERSMRIQRARVRPPRRLPFRCLTTRTAPGAARADLSARMRVRVRCVCVRGGAAARYFAAPAFRLRRCWFSRRRCNALPLCCQRSAARLTRRTRAIRRDTPPPRLYDAPARRPAICSLPLRSPAFAGKSELSSRSRVITVLQRQRSMLRFSARCAAVSITAENFRVLLLAAFATMFFTASKPADSDSRMSEKEEKPSYGKLMDYISHG